VSLRDAWEQAAAEWIAWARTPDHDVYWTFHRDALFSLLPAPGDLTIDIGCGEGRVARDLASLGHHVVGLDGSVTLARAAADHPGCDGPLLVADASRLPLRDEVADLAVAFMSFQDVDDVAAAIAEAARVLGPGGILVMAVVHPFSAVGQFIETDGAPPSFVVTADYYSDHRTEDRVERHGLRMTFHSANRSLSSYTEAMYYAGFLIEQVREPTDTTAATTWARLPMFLHVRAVKTLAEPREKPA
jgi:ubiquinone/menaquinone biosynthesis C-methylase UbiE